MYSLVLAMALSHGAATPAWQPGENPLGGSRYGEYGHVQYRHRRGGCCGCSGGGWSCGGGCYGGGWSCRGGGCYGGMTYGGCCGGTYIVPATKEGTREKVGKPKDGEEESRALPAPATLVVSLPADATLTIDGAPTVSRSETRVFESPDLLPNKEFHYTLKAEITRNGEKLTATKQVPVRAGEATRVTLEFPPVGVAQK
jgi:uncharacterized protein (TIGR03000 family)